MQKKLKNQQIIVLVIAAGIALILGGSIATKVLATQAETYEKLKILSEVLYLIQTNYVDEIDTQDIVYGAIHGMLRTLDPHSSFMPPDMYQEMQVETRGNFGGLGIQIAIKDDQLTVIAPIDDTPAFRAGIEAGDKILKIEEQATNDMTLMEAVKLLRGPKGTQVTITIMREGFDKPREFILVRDIIEIKSVSYRMLVQNIGYLRLRQFQEDSSSEMEDALRDLEENGMEALILDLRSNPGGLLNSAVEVADKFLEKGKLIVYTEGRKKNQDMRFIAHQEFTHPNYPMAVLVNHGSASASEIVAGALQANSRAVIIGTQTYGKGSVQSVIPLSDNSGLRLTTALYYTPDGQSIHEKGIAPDIVITPEPTKEPEETQQDVSQDGTLPQEEGESIPEEKSPEEEVDQMLQQDVQLQRAVDVLRGILIFEKQSV
ncbi:MAG: S41 family peptidase [Candidatus Vecturithrix sp.]|nr:S41 family peptidase [Candidatus Vecturithrix sp.]